MFGSIIFSKLLNLNTFTDTHPSAFRSNLRIYLNGGGFSSYQSEYPYEMTCKNGSILSPINILLDPSADRNLIFFKNIFYLPIQENSFIYFFDIVAKKVIKKIEIKNNFLNEIEVSNDLIKSNKLSQGHAKILVGLDNAYFLAKKIIEKQLSVRQTENLVKIFKTKKILKYNVKDPNLKHLELTLADKIGLNVLIKNNKNNTGSLTLEYKNLEQLNKLIEVIKFNY